MSIDEITKTPITDNNSKIKQLESVSKSINLLRVTLRAFPELKEVLRKQLAWEIEADNASRYGIGVRNFSFNSHSQVRHNLHLSEQLRSSLIKLFREEGTQNKA